MDLIKDISGVEVSGNNMYCAHKEAADAVRRKLRAEGYDITQRPSHMPQPNELFPTDYARKTVVIATCNHCAGVVDLKLATKRNALCPSCKNLLNSTIIEGDRLYFRFTNAVVGKDVALPAVVQQYIPYAGLLTLRIEFTTTEQPSLDRYARQTLEAHGGQWMFSEQGNYLAPILVRYFDHDELSDPPPANSVSIVPHPRAKLNYKERHLYEGSAYDLEAELPSEADLRVYETWHGPTENASDHLLAGMLFACGDDDYKVIGCQDGSYTSSEATRKRMTAYLKHCTTLDADKFWATWPDFATYGNQFLLDLHDFCTNMANQKGTTS